MVAWVRRTAVQAAALLPTAYSNAHFRSGMLKASHSHGQPIKQVDPHPTQEQWRAAHQQYANRTNAWRAHVWSINQAQAAKLRKYASAKGLRQGHMHGPPRQAWLEAGEPAADAQPHPPRVTSLAQMSAAQFRAVRGARFDSA